MARGAQVLQPKRYAMNAFDPRLPLIAAAARVKTCHVFHCFAALREMGKAFHAGAFATFAGLEERHVAAILAALEEHDALPEKRAASTRGQRLPNDWQAPDEWINWAVNTRHWRPDDAREEAELFANYWQARSGSGAAKLDWKKTWMNWVRNSRRPDGDYVVGTGKPQDYRTSTLRTIALYERMGRTYEAEGLRRDLEQWEAGKNVVPFRSVAP